MTFHETLFTHRWNTTIYDFAEKVKSVAVRSIPFEQPNVTYLSKWNNGRIELDLISNLYSIREFQTVSRFILEHRYLLPLLIEGYWNIKEIFGEVPLVLKVEGEQEDRKLYLLIKVNDEIDNAHDLLDILDEQWWFNNVSQAKFKMNIDLEY